MNYIKQQIANQCIKYFFLFFICTVMIVSIKVNVNAESKTFGISSFSDKTSSNGTKYVSFNVNTDKAYKGKHFHFKKNESSASWTLKMKDGTTYSNSGSFDHGDEWYPAWFFAIGDFYLTSVGKKASDIVSGTVTIKYNKMENCTGDWIIDQDSTCTIVGAKHKTCSICGGITTDDIEKKPHEYKYRFRSYEDERGCYLEFSECENCGATKDEHIVPHKFTRPGSIRTELTCTQNETVWLRCEVCGYQSNTEYQTTENARGHNWVWEIDSTLSCTSNYTGHKTCIRSCHNPDIDGSKTTNLNTVFASAPGHNYTKFVCDKKATCTEPGSGHYECSNVINGSVCGDIGKTVTIPATGHHMTYDEVTEKPTVYTNGTRTYYCEYCNQAITTRDVLHRNFNVYLGGKRVTMISKGDDIVWNGSYGEQGSDGGKTSTDDVNSLVESNWYYDY